MQTHRRWYRVDRRQISFVKFILEAYDNIAVLTTVDAWRAIVQISVAPGGETIVDAIVAEFAGEFECIAVDEGEAAVENIREISPGGSTNTATRGSRPWS